MKIISIPDEEDDSIDIKTFGLSVPCIIHDYKYVYLVSGFSDNSNCYEGIIIKDLSGSSYVIGEKAYINNKSEYYYYTKQVTLQLIMEKK